MLSERNLELLTAYVDGELTRRQRKAVLRLLHQSSEARSILQELQENAHRLRELPHRKLEVAFVGQVLQSISDRGLQPAPEPVLRRRLPRWVGYGAAASVVFAVGLGIYLASHRAQTNDAGPVAGLPGVVPESLPQPLQVAFKDLAYQPKRELLAKQLQKENSVHLKVTVGNNANAVEHLQDVLKGEGIHVIVDARTKANLKKGQGKVEYLVYAENVRTEELETILRQLADDPKNKPTQKSTFESMVVTSLSVADRRNLSGLLGVDASELEAPKPHGDSELFDTMIIEAPKDKSKKAAPTPLPRSERYAMVIANDMGPGGPSLEVKRFLASRTPFRAGTVQVLLVIRQA